MEIGEVLQTKIEEVSQIKIEEELPMEGTLPCFNKEAEFKRDGMKIPIRTHPHC